VLFAAAAVAASSIFDAVKPFGFEDPDSEVARAYDAFEDATGRQATPGVIALVEPDGGARSPAGRSQLRDVEARLSAVEGIAEVQGPSELGRDAISTDGEAAYVLGFLAAGEDDPTAVGERALSELGDLAAVTVGGPAVAAHELGEQSEEDLRHVELIAAPFLLLLSLWVFRGVVAALLPVVIGAVSIVGTIGIMRGVTELVELDLFSINIVTGLGLGLAIDYSLLIVARYREELAGHGPGWMPIHRTLETAGRTVVFSGVTIAFALIALLVFPQRFLYSVAIGGSLVAALSALVAVTVLPAILALLEERVNALSLPGRARAAAGAPETGGRWYRLVSLVMRRPLPVATLTAAVMIAAGIPFLNVDLTTPDARILPPQREAKVVDDRLRSDFAGPATTPLVAVVDVPRSGNPVAEVSAVTAEIESLPNVSEVSDPTPLGSEAVQVSVVAGVDALSDEGQDVLRELRDIEWPSATLIGGRTAELVDQKQSLEDHIPLAIAIIAILTLITLWIVTGSVVLPFVALVMNLLTISAAFGVLVLIFQDGRFESLFDFTSPGALDSSMPILLFAVAFGLSTDYGIFLLSRVKEARDEGAPDSEAVAIGLERSGRVVTAAALLFAVAMGAFVLSDLVILKETAVGLCVAVLLDATIVRAFLFPSLVRLLGGVAWWSPGPLARARQRLGFS
jgi:uncharacterized membrane protein YdfJ with MMPL/SSD domain